MTTAYITDTRFAQHTLKGHAESAERLIAVQDLLKSQQVVERMLSITPQPATIEQIAEIHDAEYLELLAWTETQKGVQLGPDTYVLPQSYGIAKLSSGAAIAGVDAVLTGQADNALVCARPPGHHATPTMGMGFCLLSNIAIAARHAQCTYDLKRVMIVDYDVHHGNGTQDAFYIDDSVMFLSTHQYPLYPGTGATSEIGIGPGAGMTVNIPVPEKTGDENYAKIYSDIVWPIAERFKPELLMVSAGMDAHWADPLAQLQLTLPGYSHLNHELIAMAKKLCGGKIVFVMEGGYNLISLSHGILNVAYALLGDLTVSDPLGKARKNEPQIASLIEQVKRLHSLT